MHRRPRLTGRATGIRKSAACGGFSIPNGPSIIRRNPYLSMVFPWSLGAPRIGVYGRKPPSRLPSSLSQFEEAIGHWRGRRGSDGQSLVDCFQDKAAVEAPGEGAEVAREMFGRDGAVRGQ